MTAVGVVVSQFESLFGILTDAHVAVGRWFPYWECGYRYRLRQAQDYWKTSLATVNECLSFILIKETIECT